MTALSPFILHGQNFPSSYPTFDDDFKLSAEHWVCSFVPDLVRTANPIGALERDRGFEPPLLVWKTRVLAVKH